jgi:hypothetical protein
VTRSRVVPAAGDVDVERAVLPFLLLGLALVVGLALWMKLVGMEATARGGALRFDDPDTVRRLVRLRHLVDPATPYPYRDPADGWRADPERRGTVLHWTLPMDGVILALDPLFAPLHPAARRFEAGAAWSAPVLGTLAVAAFAALALRWLDAAPALLATLLYALSYDVLAVTGFGDGNHASLQHLSAVGALMGFFAVLSGRGGRRLGLLTGAALGLGLWVSTETTVVFLAMALGAFASLLVSPAARRLELARAHVVWAVAALVVTAIGDRVEHPGAGLTLQWDTVSGFQLHQLLVFLLFAILAARGRPTILAAAVALVAGLLPFALSPTYRAALSAQFALVAAVNRWTQSEISEYGRLLSIEGFFVPNQAWEHFSWLIVASPVCLLAFALDGRRPAALRAGLAVAAIGLFMLTCYEMKLGHLFAIVHPVVLVAGGASLIGRIGARLGATGSRLASGLAALATVGAFLLCRHPAAGVPIAKTLAGGSFAANDPRWDDDNPGNQLIRELKRLPPGQGDQRAVLADWTLGAFILYQTDHPVVASGYHRNLDGIRDAYRVFVARIPEDVPTLAAILRDRGVRWIVTRYDPALFVRGSRTFPELGEFGRTQRIVYHGGGLYDAIAAPPPPETRRTFLWHAHLGGYFAGPVRAADQVIQLQTDVPRGSLRRGQQPNFIIYGVERVAAE